MGSIEKHGKNTFRLGIVIGYDDLGKPIRERRTVKAKNKTEVKFFLNLKQKFCLVTILNLSR
jgi:integrase